MSSTIPISALFLRRALSACRLWIWQELHRLAVFALPASCPAAQSCPPCPVASAASMHGPDGLVLDLGIGHPMYLLISLRMYSEFLMC